jgi:iron complex outermembrane receptor protein
MQMRMALIAGSLVALPVFANSPDPGSLDALKRMSVEDLMNVEVTSVSRTEEPLLDAAAAVAVVTRETIRRSGATTLPDALRLVPGLHVGQQNSSTWAMSARGFSSITSEKLLVLSDTRSIYTPLFSGVEWDVQDFLLEDIERVEVVRGPGATLWGSNAVNGVINITTRSARDTHGTYLEAGGGNFDRGWIAARYGAETEGGVHYRVFGKYRDRAGTDHLVTDTDDAWNFAHGGFRTDWDANGDDSFTVQGDLYSGDIGQLHPAVTIVGRPGPQGNLGVDVSGGNLLGRWRRHTSDTSDTQLRVYYDYSKRDDPSYEDTLQTFDIDFQNRLIAASRHEIIWGASYRLTSNDNRSGGIFAVDPEKSDDQLFSGFIQDQISLADSVRLTLGTKLEDNDFSGFEVQPSIRVTWTPRPSQALWSAISRAVRVPTRLERDIAIEALPPGSNPTAILLGNPDFESEELIAYEAGYRWQALPNLAFDIALFYNDYQSLASLEFGEPYIEPSGRIVFPVMNQNLTSGHTRGAELLAEWSPLPNWHLTGSYTHIDMSLTPNGEDINRGEWLEGSTPRSLAGLRSLLTLAERFELDAQLRYQSRIRSIPVAVTVENGQVDEYVELDLRMCWRVSEAWDLSLVGQNLLHDEHAEFGPVDQRGNLERSAYLKVSVDL